MSDNEFYTPPRYVNAARDVMGSIDLDPASCEVANSWIQATRYYTKEQNGLLQPWYGNVWLNPPFGLHLKEKAPWQGASQSGLFVQRLLWEYREGNIEQAILLAKADPKQLWFIPLWDYMICFCTKDVYFQRPDKIPTCIQFGTCFVYLGPHEARFIDTFSRFGRIVKSIDTPAHTQLRLLEKY